VTQAQAVAKALAGDKHIPKPKPSNKARPKVSQVSPTDELIKSVPKVISEYKEVQSEIKKVNKVFARLDCPYISENILHLKNLNQKKRIDEEYLESVVQGAPKQCAP
jgi:hypothetical protein